MQQATSSGRGQKSRTKSELMPSPHATGITGETRIDNESSFSCQYNLISLNASRDPSKVGSSVNAATRDGPES